MRRNNGEQGKSQLTDPRCTFRRCAAVRWSPGRRRPRGTLPGEGRRRQRGRFQTHGVEHDLRVVVDLFKVCQVRVEVLLPQAHRAVDQYVRRVVPQLQARRHDVLVSARKLGPLEALQGGEPGVVRVEQLRLAGKVLGRECCF